MIKRSGFHVGMCAVIFQAVIGARICRGSGYEFEGIGAREVSRGGAAIADSADWTAIYWNPANIQKAVEDRKADMGLELFAGQAHATDGNSLSSTPVGAAFSKDKLSSNFLLGAIGGAVKVSDRVSVGGGFYTPLLQGVDFSDDSKNPPAMNLHYKASAGILTWALETAFRVTDKFYAGLGVDLLYGKLKSDSRLTNFPFPTNDIQNKLDGAGFGLEGIFGLRYEASKRLAIGAVYRTGSDVALKGNATVGNTNPLVPGESTKFRYELRHPPTTGVGIAFKPTEQWSLDADFTQTYWHRFTSAFAYKNQGLFLQNTNNGFDWHDSWKLRFGTGYWVTEKTEVLGGYSFDKAALDPGSVDFANTVDVPMNRVYAGASHRWSDRWESTVGGVYGAGRRSEANATYHLSGWQVMLETRLRV